MSGTGFVKAIFLLAMMLVLAVSIGMILYALFGATWGLVIYLALVLVPLTLRWAYLVVTSDEA